MLIIISDSFKLISYGLYRFEIDSSWVEGIEYKFKNEQHYRSYQEFSGKMVQIISILQIEHKIKNNNIPIFNDGENDEGKKMTARERVVNIFSGFENGEKIKPIELYRQENVDECVNLFEYKAGCHRLHCSIVYGFKMIPAIVFNRSENKTA